MSKIFEHTVVVTQTTTRIYRIRAVAAEEETSGYAQRAYAKHVAKQNVEAGEPPDQESVGEWTYSWLCCKGPIKEDHEARRQR